YTSDGNHESQTQTNNTRRPTNFLLSFCFYLSPNCLLGAFNADLAAAVPTPVADCTIPSFMQ
ncbi:MAG TPA: hypothetical protein VF437_09325, partial [Verrucomicrobiae bacterium]